MEHRANGRAEVMEIFEQAVDDERAIGGDGLDDGERIVVVTGDGFDSRDRRLGADGKVFVRRLHESKAALGRDALAMVAGITREEPLGKGCYKGRRVRGKVS